MGEMARKSFERGMGVINTHMTANIVLAGPLNSIAGSRIEGKIRP